MDGVMFMYSERLVCVCEIFDDVEFIGEICCLIFYYVFVVDEVFF